jgi:hypothetical protein
MVRPSAEGRLGVDDWRLSEAEERLLHLEGAVLLRLGRARRARALAAELLATMRQTFALMVAHRATIMRELVGDGLEP